MLKNRLKTTKYAGDERGSIIVFVLVIFTAMFLVGGTAVDLARHETLRTTLQYNLDRAVLAAASLKQTQDPEVVVNDYMDKVVSISEFSVVVTSEIRINRRAVSATATADLETWFLSMAGIDEMPITALSAASEEIPNLEIVLVLDVSGSMGSNSKLTNLKVAAKEFVTTMLTGADPDTVAISIVPFNNGVAPNNSIFESLTVNETHGYSACLDFADADFSSVSMDPTVAQNQLAYTSVYEGGWESFDSGSRTCYTDDYFEILPYSDDETTLHDKIDSFQADGWTAGHLGMKWGNALLDPAFQSIGTSLIAAGEVDAGFAGLPVAYTDSETLKVIIMMGDGANTYEYRFGSSFMGANSDLYEVVFTTDVFDYAYKKRKPTVTSTNESKCSNSRWICVYSTASVTKYYLHKSSNNTFYDTDESDWISSSEFADLPTTLTGWESTTQMAWEDAWGHMAAEWYSDKVNDWTAYNDLKTGTARNSSEADVVMQDACDASEAAGIVVYAIGFETSESTSAKLEACASTSSHYYDAEGTQISSVFAAIASSIQKLKLTQ
ncbi:MAG: hypothetical protein GY952_05600 [Rhodobacteraceae bacterium]|nr:hypothetical protein [Paracoccaceae bacterium]